MVEAVQSVAGLDPDRASFKPHAVDPAPALLPSPPVRAEQAVHAAGADPATIGHRDPAQ
ncbi:MAG: hypothetical protein M3325_15575 [Actinomycetota bacterium]|nr:hypothetical protein [Actinomycetota bacterium]